MVDDAFNVMCVDLWINGMAKADIRVKTIYYREEKELTLIWSQYIYICMYICIYKPQKKHGYRSIQGNLRYLHKLLVTNKNVHHRSPIFKSYEARLFEAISKTLSDRPSWLFIRSNCALVNACLSSSNLLHLVKAEIMRDAT